MSIDQSIRNIPFPEHPEEVAPTIIKSSYVPSDETEGAILTPSLESLPLVGGAVLLPLSARSLYEKMTVRSMVVGSLATIGSSEVVLYETPNTSELYLFHEGEITVEDQQTWTEEALKNSPVISKIGIIDEGKFIVDVLVDLRHAKTAYNVLKKDEKSDYDYTFNVWTDEYDLRAVTAAIVNIPDENGKVKQTYIGDKRFEEAALLQARLVDGKILAEYEKTKKS